MPRVSTCGALFLRVAERKRLALHGCGAFSLTLIPSHFDQNSYDAGADEEDEPAEAKFSDDEEEKAYLREQKRGAPATTNSVRQSLIQTRCLTSSHAYPFPFSCVALILSLPIKHRRLLRDKKCAAEGVAAAAISRDEGEGVAATAAVAAAGVAGAVAAEAAPLTSTSSPRRTAARCSSPTRCRPRSSRSTRAGIQVGVFFLFC